jgi:hypothetical protein
MIPLRVIGKDAVLLCVPRHDMLAFLVAFLNGGPILHQLRIEFCRCLRPIRGCPCQRTTP